MKISFPKVIRISLFVAVVGLAEAGIYASAGTCDTMCCTPVIRGAAVNHSYLNSPRGREEFPWLARSQSANEARTARALPAETNRALMSSPRFREEHPELLRTGGNAATATAQLIPIEIRKNTALAASPRAREEFPALRVTDSGATARKNLCVCACASL